MGLLRQRAEMLHPSCCSAISAKLCSYWKCSTKHSLHAFFCYHKFLGNLSTVLPCFFPWYSEETPQSITVGSIPFSMLYPLFFFQHHLILPLQQHTHYSFFRFISMSCHPDGPFLLISSPLPYATTLSSWISNPAPSSSHQPFTACLPCLPEEGVILLTCKLILNGNPHLPDSLWSMYLTRVSYDGGNKLNRSRCTLIQTVAWGATTAHFYEWASKNSRRLQSICWGTEKQHRN